MRRWRNIGGGLGLRLVLAGVISAVLAIGFFSLSRAVVRGSTGDLDERILLAMRVPGVGRSCGAAARAEEVGRDMTAAGRRRRVVADHGDGGVVLLARVDATGGGLRGHCQRGRDSAGDGSSSNRSTGRGLTWCRVGRWSTRRAFPSGHSTMAAAVYLTLGMVASRFVPRRRLKVLLIGVAMAVTAAMGVSRVYLGVHWPSDVLGGWAVPGRRGRRSAGAWRSGCRIAA